jgi:hypothetical protein
MNVAESSRVMIPAAVIAAPDAGDSALDFRSGREEILRGLIIGMGGASGSCTNFNPSVRCVQRCDRCREGESGPTLSTSSLLSSTPPCPVVEALVGLSVSQGQMVHARRYSGAVEGVLTRRSGAQSANSEPRTEWSRPSVVTSPAAISDVDRNASSSWPPLEPVTALRPSSEVRE